MEMVPKLTVLVRTLKMLRRKDIKHANVGKPNTKYEKLRKLPSDNAIVVVLV